MLHAGNFTAELNPGRATLAFTLSTKPDATLDAAAALERRPGARRRVAAHVGRRPSACRAARPGWIRTLVLAADQFVVQRTAGDGTQFPSIIAGYPWFADWGRDTMTSLPGLLLRTGRADVARDSAARVRRLVDRGMLPNYFPDDGGAPQYNTVDGSLLFIDALHRYVQATGDRGAAGRPLRHRRAQSSPPIATARATASQVRRRRPALRRSRRRPIDVDGRAGRRRRRHATARQARRDQRAVVSRARGSGRVRRHARARRAPIRDAGRTRRRHRSESSGIRRRATASTSSTDPTATMRRYAPTSCSPRRSHTGRYPTISCARSSPPVRARLLTPAGLRTLATDAPGYRGAFGGSPSERDGAYHQGTVWPWLIGPFVAAAINVGIDRARAMSYLVPIAPFNDGVRRRFASRGGNRRSAVRSRRLLCTGLERRQACSMRGRRSPKTLRPSEAPSRGLHRTGANPGRVGRGGRVLVGRSVGGRHRVPIHDDDGRAPRARRKR